MVTKNEKDTGIVLEVSRYWLVQEGSFEKALDWNNYWFRFLEE